MPDFAVKFVLDGVIVLPVILASLVTPVMFTAFRRNKSISCPPLPLNSAGKNLVTSCVG